MPSQPNAILGASGARQLLRRATFTPSPVEVAKFEGRTRQWAADKLVDFKPARFRPRHQNIAVAHGKWIKYLLRTGRQLQEKLVLFWHDHFATGYDKVLNSDSMSLQNRTLRTFCNGNFKNFVKAINVDPAMMEYLDTVRNRKTIPNENYGRELMEIFCLGVFDLNGKANYQQADVFQVARAFTGWRVDGDDLTPYFDSTNFEGGGGRHDYMAWYPARGPKVLFGTPRDDAPGNVGGFASPQSYAPIAAVNDPTPGSQGLLNSEGPIEIDAVIDILFQHKDTDGASTVARFIAKKLLSYFCYANPDKTLIDEVIADSDFATDAHENQWHVGALLKAIFVNDAFYETAAEPDYTPASKKSVRWPIDYVIGTMRLLRMRTFGPVPSIPDTNQDVGEHLEAMGQILFVPPSVFGWDWETSWISSTTLLARYSFARDLTSARDGSGRTIFRPDKLIDIEELTDAGDIVDAVLEVLAMTDFFTDTERDVLIDYLTDGSPMTPVDLLDYDTRNIKLHGLFAQILQSPHYQVQ